MSKVCSSQARGDCSRNRVRSRLPPNPLARSVLSMKYASARIFIGLPKSPNKCGASAPNPAQSLPQVSASFADSAAIRAVVAARSVDTPHQLPSGKAEQNGWATGTNSSPCLIKSAECALKNADPPNSDRFIAAQSWRKPGRVYSPVFTAPPATAACSNSATRQPFAARCKAAARVLCPAPTKTAS